MVAGISVSDICRECCCSKFPNEFSTYTGKKQATKRCGKVFKLSLKIFSAEVGPKRRVLRSSVD